jgi:Protein of unknown function (DUF1446).
LRSIRIGSGAGTALDIVEPAIDILKKGDLDYLCFECLAERTLAMANIEKFHDSTKGYNTVLDDRMGRIFDTMKTMDREKWPKIISNMGAANPIGCVERLVQLARERGMGGIKIAAVTGDNVFAKIDKFLDKPTMETGIKLEEYKENIVSANAYIGAAGIIEALNNGADIVITGRCADPTLFLAPAIFEFGWSMDDWDKIASGTIAGHLMECSSMVTGGYFADPEYGKISEELWNIAFPIEIIYENGEVDITKIDGSGGVVNTMTVKEQLGYEVNNPMRYLTPDVVCDFSNLEVEQIDKDIVHVKGGKGHPKTGTYKLNVGYRDGYIGEAETMYGGLTCVSRAKIALEYIQKRLDISGVEYTDVKHDIMGINSLFGDKLASEWTGGETKYAEIRIRTAIRTKDRQNAEKVYREYEILPMSGPGGGGGFRGYVKEVLSVVSVLIDAAEVDINIDYMEV